MAVRVMPIVTICVNQFSVDIPTACFEFEGALFDPRGKRGRLLALLHVYFASDLHLKLHGVPNCVF